MCEREIDSEREMEEGREGDRRRERSLEEGEKFLILLTIKK